MELQRTFRITQVGMENHREEHLLLLGLQGFNPKETGRYALTLEKANAWGVPFSGRLLGSKLTVSFVGRLPAAPKYHKDALINPASKIDLDELQMSFKTPFWVLQTHIMYRDFYDPRLHTEFKLSLNIEEVPLVASPHHRYVFGLKMTKS